MSSIAGPLADRLRLVVITDEALAHPRPVLAVVEAALAAGAPCIQFREKHRTLRDALALGRELRRRTLEFEALLIVNDRFDLALAIEADGVHLGPDDLPVAAIRTHAPPGFIIGFSTDDPQEAWSAQTEGADYLGCGTVWPTSSKPDAGEAIGPGGVARVVQAVSIPVVAIGGGTVERAPLLHGTGAVGLAVIGAVMGAEDPTEATRGLLRAPWR